jgi:predicted XRE-type DNA-binding protein
VQFDLTEGRYADQEASLYTAKNDPVDMARDIVELLGDPERRARMWSLRSELMDKIAAVVAEKGWTQIEAAAHCGVTQPRVNDLLRGRISRVFTRCPGEHRSGSWASRPRRTRGGLIFFGSFAGFKLHITNYKVVDTSHRVSASATQGESN